MPVLLSRFSVLLRGFELPPFLPPLGHPLPQLRSGSLCLLVLLASCLIGFLVLGPPLWGTLVPAPLVLGPPLQGTLVPTLTLPLRSADRIPRPHLPIALSTALTCAVALLLGPCLPRLVPKEPGVLGSGLLKSSRAAGPPLSSAPLAVKPVCYVVLRSGRLDRPARFATFAALRRAIGEISGSDSVLHSFGSLAEARVYCYAAGVPFPDLLQ